MEIFPSDQRLHGAGFTTNEFASPETLPPCYKNPEVSILERRTNAALGIDPDTKLTAGEESYFASGGVNIGGIFGELGRAVAPDGTIGFRTLDGRVVSGADYAEGFCAGDVVQLKSGGPRMTVMRQIYPIRITCEWFVGGDVKQGSFDPGAIRYLGHAEDLPPETTVPVATLQEHRQSLMARGDRASAAKVKRVRPSISRRRAA